MTTHAERFQAASKADAPPGEPPVGSSGSWGSGITIPRTPPGPAGCGPKAGASCCSSNQPLILWARWGLGTVVEADALITAMTDGGTTNGGEPDPVKLLR